MRGIFRPSNVMRRPLNVLPKELQKRDVVDTQVLEESSGSGLEQLNPKLQKLIVRPLKKPKNIKINLK
jgi:hypothetical protein